MAQPAQCLAFFPAPVQQGNFPPFFEFFKNPSTNPNQKSGKLRLKIESDA
jgi:hypothetical protein